MRHGVGDVARIVVVGGDVAGPPLATRLGSSRVRLRGSVMPCSTDGISWRFTAQREPHCCGRPNESTARTFHRWPARTHERTFRRPSLHDRREARAIIFAGISGGTEKTHLVVAGVGVRAAATGVLQAERVERLFREPGSPRILRLASRRVTPTTAPAIHRVTNGPASSAPPRSSAFRRSYTAGRLASHSISGPPAASYRWSKEHD